LTRDGIETIYFKTNADCTISNDPAKAAMPAYTSVNGSTLTINGYTVKFTNNYTGMPIYIKSVGNAFLAIVEPGTTVYRQITKDTLSSNPWLIYEPDTNYYFSYNVNDAGDLVKKNMPSYYTLDNTDGSDYTASVTAVGLPIIINNQTSYNITPQLNYNVGFVAPHTQKIENVPANNPSFVRFDLWTRKDWTKVYFDVDAH